MNERNVEALAALIRAERDEHYYEQPTDPESLARWLAGRGCLVPAALTDEEALIFDNSGDYIELRGGRPVTDTETATDIRDRLAHIAQGSPPTPPS